MHKMTKITSHGKHPLLDGFSVHTHTALFKVNFTRNQMKTFFFIVFLNVFIYMLKLNVMFHSSIKVADRVLINCSIDSTKNYLSN